MVLHFHSGLESSPCGCSQPRNLFAEDLSALLVVLLDGVEIEGEARRPLVLMQREPVQCVSVEPDRFHPGHVRRDPRTSATAQATQ
jgi:hypothetical protein